MPVSAVCYQSQRQNIANTRVVEFELSDPQPGSVLLSVDSFALTANNITYGVAGDSIGYWQFFPAQDPAGSSPSSDVPATQWGCIPVWGFGTVVQTNHPEVAVGERLYGYFPMASHVLLQPTKVGALSLTDGVEHRSQLPVVYNQYVKTAVDPAYVATHEAEQMLYRPLFTTSFFLDDFLDDNDFFGVDRVILTSASSKTSLGLAHLLHANRDCRVIGLTSAGNMEFVRGLGCYHDVLSYDDVGQLEQLPSVMVDMAGSGKVRASVHNHLADELKYSCAVGATHWEDATVGGGGAAVAGPKPVMFFAPTQIGKRLQQWGRETYDARMGAAWRGFLQAADSWIEVANGRGVQSLDGVYQQFIAGDADPAKGYVQTLAAD